METSRTFSPTRAESATHVGSPAAGLAEAGVFAGPSDTTSMTVLDYAQLVSALSTAAGLLSTRQEQLNAADLRIRSLVSLAEKEAKRALLEASCRQRAGQPETEASLAT